MNAQEIFDTVAIHLLTQNKKSVYFGVQCRYRAPNNLKCAIGILIPDDIYTDDMEGLGVGGLLDSYDISPTLPKYFMKHRDLLAALQLVHDKNDPEYWKGELVSVSTIFDLDPKILEIFQ